MKNTARIVAAMLVLVMVACVFVSCGANLAGMEKKLEDNGYSATYLDKAKIEKNDTDDLSVAEKLVFAGASALLKETDVNGVLVGAKGLSGIVVIEFNNEDDAKAVEEGLGKIGTAERSGKVVYFGDEDSIKIVK